MKVVLVGGHLSPALAVLEKLEKQDVYYIGRKHSFEGDDALSLEYQEILKLGIPFFALKTARFQRKFTRYTLASFLKMPIGFYQALRILNNIKPDVVLSFGGYLSVPVGLAASALRTPLVLHEQTFEIGFANKILSPLAKKICISFESSKKFFPKGKTVLTGNPIKKDILKLLDSKKISNNLPLIYITGGSSGSHAINELVANSLEKLLEKYTIFHQTGDSKIYNDFEKLTLRKNNLKKEKSKNYTLVKFLIPKDSALMLSKADLVVGRSGINTVTELIYLKKPALLIPLPFSQKNEQFKNAGYMKELGLAEIMEQNLITPDLFISKITFMFKNINNYKLRKKVVFKNSAEDIINILKDVYTQKTA
nr:UDP-N-acetylglucosamine--N-acetylmuramyl-(pentapeptide) pyrophosphoryl-undecaprenol N-acetylglucosamine transferase [Candidatus Levybacteria bacterium]